LIPESVKNRRVVAPALIRGPEAGAMTGFAPEFTLTKAGGGNDNAPPTYG